MTVQAITAQPIAAAPNHPDACPGPPFPVPVAFVIDLTALSVFLKNPAAEPRQDNLAHKESHQEPGHAEHQIKIGYAPFVLFHRVIDLHLLLLRRERKIL
jgi:hypothetical protein